MTAVDPIRLFAEWYGRAQETDLPEPSAATLATVGADGMPSARVVLVRGYDERGFVFYTNTGSRKGRDLGGLRGADRPASLCFYWPPLALQVRVEGRAEAVAPDEADAYWASRPRGHQVAAYASRQSEPLAGGRQELEAAFVEWDRKLPQENIPRPGSWSGYRVVPTSIEFWEGRGNRMHHRVLYERDGSGWTVSLLNP
jgi:pyridoxamine 5'-phosphate oxidase